MYTIVNMGLSINYNQGPGKGDFYCVNSEGFDWINLHHRNNKEGGLGDS